MTFTSLRTSEGTKRKKVYLRKLFCIVSKYVLVQLKLMNGWAPKDFFFFFYPLSEKDVINLLRNAAGHTKVSLAQEGVNSGTFATKSSDGSHTCESDN